jgi:hypothetical protein
LIKDNPQVLLAEDEQPVQRFVAEGLDHSARNGRWLEVADRA